MRSTMTATNSLLAAGLAATALLLGCSAASPNQYVDDSPATQMEWNSPTATRVLGETEARELRTRDHMPLQAASATHEVTHWPLYFEDPFVDKGSGRDDHRLGWEDWVALPYGYSRFTLNWLFLPVSAIVTPPWTLMESDGRLSQQMLGYDHDATKSTRSAMDVE